MKNRVTYRSDFPKWDAFWTQTLDAAQAMIAPADAVCAHAYFLEFFPGALSYLALEGGEFRAVDWLIFHKDAIRHAVPGAMRRIKEDFTPVFANEVFVLFAGASVASRAPRRDFDPAHAGSLWVMAEEFENNPRRRAS